MTDMKTLTIQDFEKLVDTAFEARLRDEAVALSLVEVKAMGAGSAKGARFPCCGKARANPSSSSRPTPCSSPRSASRLSFWCRLPKRTPEFNTRRCSPECGTRNGYVPGPSGTGMCQKIVDTLVLDQLETEP